MVHARRAARYFLEKLAWTVERNAVGFRRNVRAPQAGLNVEPRRAPL